MLRLRRGVVRVLVLLESYQEGLGCAKTESSCSPTQQIMFYFLTQGVGLEQESCRADAETLRHRKWMWQGAGGVLVRTAAPKTRRQ